MNNFKNLLETFNVGKPGTITFGKPKITKIYGREVKFDIKVDIEGETSTYYTIEFNTDDYHDNIDMVGASKSGVKSIGNASFDSIIFNRKSGKKQYHLIAKKGKKESVVIGIDETDSYYPDIIIKGVPKEIEKAIRGK